MTGANGSEPSRRRRPDGVSLRKHLDHMRVAEMKDVYAFWAGEDAPPAAARKELLERLLALMSQEGAVYRRVRSLTRKVLDVLLLLLRREGFTSDLPGLFQRLAGEDATRLEFHEAEAGLKALHKRGFLAEASDRAMATNGRVLYSVPHELGALLISLFREETRRVASVFSLAEHATAITASERWALRQAFPRLATTPGPEDVAVMLADGGGPARIDALPAPLRDVVGYAIRPHGGILLRTAWQARGTIIPDVRWDREKWGPAIENGGVGTIARLSLADYGIACDDEATVVFGEVLEDTLRRRDRETIFGGETLRAGGDLIADLCALLDHARREPLKKGRDGEIYRAARRRIQEGFVFRESSLAGPPEIWAEVMGAAEHLGLVQTDAEGFLELAPAAQRFVDLPLEQKVHELYRAAVEQPGPEGKSLHQRELRTVVADCLREEPDRTWGGNGLAVVARHRYLATLDRRGIRERHRDRFFSAYFSGRETLRDLLVGIESRWLPRLYVLGLLDVVMDDDTPVAWRLSSLGARVLGAAPVQGIDTGLLPLVVNPDFEIVVLPEGDVLDVVHVLDAHAQRVKSGEVVHFRLTKEAMEAAVVAGRSVEDFLTFLEGRARGGVPQNVAYTVRGWAAGVGFATLERGVVLRAQSEAVLDRILALPEMSALLLRRLGNQEVLLKEEPQDRRVRAALRDQGIHLRGP